MATLRKLPFFFLTLVILGAGGYAQSEFFEYQLRLAQQGDALAQFVVGAMYHDGQGVPKDYKEAVKWYRKAADQGTKWYQAADQGIAHAQHNLGVMYAKDEGVPRDYLLAYMWINLG